eukprot:CAMPEP_0119301032 /NCGR_PEP_ID=MMETSP1333-20130426/2894_1 /TAXON_ID=418940 /ORGANISM="Scyphosphaera apsteinii, Strain RCC1455" /LENGTH=321 /DNA_ID=CAMNT_0007303005 /DNA_START=60 /DNA_END=1025 /DNA_ORIENTATION=+
MTSPARVAVFGATGRVGRLVVEELLHKGYNVNALVRDAAKAEEVLPACEGSRLKLSTVDISTSSGDMLRGVLAGDHSIIWCASGFTTAGKSVDLMGMSEIAPIFSQVMEDREIENEGPRVVMLSSAGVSRPSWSDTKKERLVGAADIPIIRLNPGGILGKKCEAEELLRASGIEYCVVRPTGLKFDGWARGRPIISQGDVAVGRTNPDDLAELLVSLLDEPESKGKTFEVFTLAGYPAPRTLSSALERLKPDSEMPLPEAVTDSVYAALQQLLPGEEQDATKLEMGRTYEQLDSGEVSARERGAAATARELDLAEGQLGRT